MANEVEVRLAESKKFLSFTKFKILSFKSKKDFEK